MRKTMVIVEKFLSPCAQLEKLAQLRDMRHCREKIEASNYLPILLRVNPNILARMHWSAF